MTSYAMRICGITMLATGLTLSGCHSLSFQHHNGRGRSRSQPTVASSAEGSPTAPTIDESYHDVVDRIVHSALEHNEAYARLDDLCVGIGHRLSGSSQLERAIAWALETLQKDGQENVHREPVLVPHWVRGNESATMLESRVEPLHILGLGGSVGTPPEGITAPVVVVANEKELEAVGQEAAGSIVLFNNPMPPYDPEKGSGYGTAVRFRSNGARLAADKGAVGCLVRSVTARSLGSPHTGAMHYGDAVAEIPAAAVTIEDAELIAHLVGRGEKVVVNLKMDAKTLPDAPSANVVAELRGATRPDEVVVIGGHLDSWDVGQGAHDDGGGCVMAMEVLNVLRKLGLTPKRTIRVVLWTNEENGLAGARTYAREHADELSNHVAAIESDSGVFAPRGYSLDCADEARAAVAVDQIRQILRMLPPPLDNLEAETGGSGADIGALKPAGLVLMGHRVDGTRYFDYHHSHADTIDKIDPQDLSQNVAFLAAVTYVIADMPFRLGEMRATP